MSDYLDLIGSFVIGSIVILMLANFNSTVNTSATQNLYEGVTQREMKSTSFAIEEDMYKIGLRINGEKITKADSTEISFLGDIYNFGLIDSVSYYLGKPEELKSTPNPNDRILYRKWNSKDPFPLHIVTNFKFSYFDSLGQNINYQTLKNVNGRKKIKSIKVQFTVESKEQINSTFNTAEFDKVIRPKNL